MRVSTLLWQMVLLLAGNGAAARGQVVQLPTFHQFALSTSVLVPDRGSAYLGGIGSSALGGRSAGYPGLGRLFGDAGIGGTTSTGGASVHVTIHDFEPLDRAVLAAAKKNTLAEPVDPRAAAIQDRLQRQWAARSSEAGAPALSVAEIQQRNVDRRRLQQQEAEQLLAQGQQAEADGKLGAARIFYQMAARRADGQLRQQITRRLAELRQPAP